jgi:hypothetical protein
MDTLRGVCLAALFTTLAQHAASAQSGAQTQSTTDSTRAATIGRALAESLSTIYVFPKVGRAAAGFLDDERRRREIPGTG